MEEQYSKLEITPKLIDFGSRVVQMKLVASAGIVTVYPYRNVAKALFFVGVFLVAGGFVSQPGAQYYRNQNDFPLATLMIFLGIGFLIGAVSALTTGKRLLVLSLAGNEKIVLMEAKERFLETIVSRIREAMIAPVDAPIHYTVNVTAETIHTGSIIDASQTIDNSSMSVTNSPGANVASPGAVGIGGSNSGPISAQALGNVTTNGAGVGAGKLNGRRNGSAGGDTADALAAIIASGRAAQPAPVVQAATGGIAVGGGVSGSRLSTHVSVGQDLQAMIDLVERSQAQDRAKIIEYLQVLKSLAASSAKPTDQTKQTWLTFFEYAGKALTGIDGFMVIAERAHRWFTR